MGRHSGAVCRACQQLILVRAGRLVEHRHQFPTLGTSLPCVGSHCSEPGDDTGQDERTTLQLVAAGISAAA